MWGRADAPALRKSLPYFQYSENKKTGEGKAGDDEMSGSMKQSVCQSATKAIHQELIPELAAHMPTTSGDLTPTVPDTV